MAAKHFADEVSSNWDEDDPLAGIPLRFGRHFKEPEPASATLETFTAQADDPSEAVRRYIEQLTVELEYQSQRSSARERDASEAADEYAEQEQGDAREIENGNEAQLAQTETSVAEDSTELEAALPASRPSLQAILNSVPMIEIDPEQKPEPVREQTSDGQELEPESEPEPAEEEPVSAQVEEPAEKPVEVLVEEHIEELVEESETDSTARLTIVSIEEQATAFTEEFAEEEPLEEPVDVPAATSVTEFIEESEPEPAKELTEEPSREFHVEPDLVDEPLSSEMVGSAGVQLGSPIPNPPDLASGVDESDGDELEDTAKLMRVQIPLERLVNQHQEQRIRVSTKLPEREPPKTASTAIEKRRSLGFFARIGAFVARVFHLDDH